MQIRNQDKTKAPYSNSLVCAYKLFRTEGLRNGLYEGLNTTIYREVPQYMGYFIGLVANLINQIINKKYNLI